MNRFFLQSILCVSFVVALDSSLCAQKKYSLQIGGGAGRIISDAGESNQKGRVKIQLAGYRNLQKRHAVGIEFALADNFTSMIGGNPFGENYDAGTNTHTLSPFASKATTVLAKYRYLLTDRKNFTPFIELGGGVTTYYQKIFHVPSLPSERVSRSTIVFQPEIGYTLIRFHVSASYVFGGATPPFKGVNDQNENIQLDGVKAPAFYLNFSYRFDF